MKEKVIRLFQVIGQASLEAELQNSHSGNMACLWAGENGEEYLVITRSGSQKGDLRPEDIIFLSGRSQNWKTASSELIVHRAILRLPGIKASFHAHARELTLALMVEEKEKTKPLFFIPFDGLGLTYLQGKIPLLRVKKSFGSPELARAVADKLEKFPVVLVKAHGLFARGRNLTEAFFLASIAHYSGIVARLLQRTSGDLEAWRAKIRNKGSKIIFVPPTAYEVNAEKVAAALGHQVIEEELVKVRNRLFASRLSPFYTGSISFHQRNKIFYAPAASSPRYLNAPLYQVSGQDLVNEELSWHLLVQEKTKIACLLRAHVAEAEATAWNLLSSPEKEVVYFRPLDVEGRVLHPCLPFVSPPIDKKTFLRLLQKYQVVVIRGGGVWAVSHTSLSQALHHISSVRDSCFYYLGLKEKKLI